MKKVIVLIDAGYLKQALKKAGYFGNKRTIINIAHGCHDMGSEELIKILYYDCEGFIAPKNRDGTVNHRYLHPETREPLREQPNSLAKQLAQAELFAVRLGILKFDGWSSTHKPLFRQKGVDMRIGLDIAHISHQGNIDKLILITGDTDFIPAMKYARKSNMQITIVQFPKNSIAKELKEHCDFIKKIDCSTLISPHHTS